MQPRSGDVFIASPPKCGTTWVCQLVQTLRSRGDMSFEARYAVLNISLCSAAAAQPALKKMPAGIAAGGTAASCILLLLHLLPLRRI